MKMKLYCSKTSPYARKVRVVIEELSLQEQVEEILVDPFNPTPEFLEVNPLSKIPALVTPRGEVLPDSALIVEYLTSRFPGLAPLPRGSKRWDALRRARLAEGVMDAAVASVLERRRPESIQYTAWLDRQAAAIRRALDALEREAMTLSEHPPGIVEITAAVALGYLDFRLPYLEWHQGRERLSVWFKQFALRPSMMRTQPVA